MTGRIFLFGDSIDTDQLAPGQYMKGGISELAAHCLEGVRADFAQRAGTGDLIVAGSNFGLGSSREQAAEALRYLGISAVIAKSFGGIFYRNAINLGLPVLIAKDITLVNDGDRAELDIERAQLSICISDAYEHRLTISLQPIASNIQQILSDGGLVAHLKKRFESERAENK
ncbi:MAG: 3-isopropylmalate dehydratase [Granulosicoccus sp.]